MDRGYSAIAQHSQEFSSAKAKDKKDAASFRSFRGYHQHTSGADVAQHNWEKAFWDSLEEKKENEDYINRLRRGSSQLHDTLDGREDYK